MDGSSYVPLKFCLSISTSMFSTTETYIPQRLIHHFGGNVPQKIKFNVLNGDVFEGCFFMSTHCFTGLRNLLVRYRLFNIKVLCFQYIECGEFLVTIIDSAACEIEYPTDPIYVKRSDSSCQNNADVDENRFANAYTLQENLNKNLFKLNACDCSSLKIYIYMPHQFHLELVDRVVVEDIDEAVTIDWSDGCAVFLEVDSICLEERDMVVLCRSSPNMCYNVAIYKKHACRAISVKTGYLIPRHFIKIVTEDMMQKEEMIVPHLYISKYENELTAEFEIATTTGDIYNAFFLEYEWKIVGLSDFFEGSKVGAGFTLLFCIKSPSQLFVSIYNDKLLDISMQ